MNFICSNCNKKVPVDTKKPNCECGGLWKLDFSPEKFSLEKIHKDTWNIFRYRDFMAIEGDEWKDVTLGEGVTPIIPIEKDIFVKMDFMMPTLSYKDRGAAALITHTKHIGVNSIVQDSSGNAGNSIAAYTGRSNIDSTIFVPEGTSPGKINMIKGHGSEVEIVPGSRDHCADVCRSKVHEENKYYANHVYNPFFYEGTKTYIYEVYEQLRRIPNYIFVPVGNGTLFLGVVKGLKHLLDSGIIDNMPKIVAVQSENCDPIYKAFIEKKEKPVEIEPKPTLAEGIAIGVPMRGEEILEYIYEYDIDVVTAPEDKILESRKKLAEKGIYIEHTTASIHAAFEKYRSENSCVSDVLLPMTGAGLKSD